MQYKVKELAKVWNMIGGRQIDSLQPGTIVSGVRKGDYVYVSNGVTKYAWLTEIAAPPPVEPPSSDVHPVEATVKMSDGTIWKSTEWAKQ